MTSFFKKFIKKFLIFFDNSEFCDFFLLKIYKFLRKYN